ncbi:hypothetical protein ACFQ0B_56850 [Nonomuraea thailandensis]
MFKDADSLSIDAKSSTCTYTDETGSAVPSAHTHLQLHLHE